MNPTNLKAVADGRNIVLTWDTMPEAAFYSFGRGPGVTGQKIETATQTILNVEPGTYTFALLAYYGRNGEAGVDETKLSMATVTVPP